MNGESLLPLTWWSYELQKEYPLQLDSRTFPTAVMFASVNDASKRPSKVPIAFLILPFVFSFYLYVVFLDRYLARPWSSPSLSSQLRKLTNSKLPMMCVSLIVPLPFRLFSHAPFYAYLDARTVHQDGLCHS